MKSTPNPIEEIKAHQASIDALKASAVVILRERRKEVVTELAGIDSQIAELTGRTPETKPRRKRSPSVDVSIEQVCFAINSGFTNNQQIAKQLGCSPAKVKQVIARDGKKLITSTGERSKFAYSLK